MSSIAKLVEGQWTRTWRIAVNPITIPLLPRGKLILQTGYEAGILEDPDTTPPEDMVRLVCLPYHVYAYDSCSGNSPWTLLKLLKSRRILH